MADTIQFESGSTFHLSAWSVDGASPSTWVTIESTTPGVAHNLVNDTAGVFTSTWCIISDSHASDAALWTAGTGSEDRGGNAGWWAYASPAVTDHIYFDPGSTYNITGWTVNGSAGAAVLITSNPPTATHYLVRTAGGPFTSDWCVISHSDASADADWAAGANSFDAGDNRNGGWFQSTVYADAIGCVVYILAYAAQPLATTEAVGAQVVTPTGIATNATGCVAESAQVYVGARRPDTSVSANTHHALVDAKALQPDGLAHADSGGARVDTHAIASDGVAQADIKTALAQVTTNKPDVVANADLASAQVVSGPGLPITEAHADTLSAAQAISTTQAASGIAQVNASTAEASVIGAHPDTQVDADAAGARVIGSTGAVMAGVVGLAGSAAVNVETTHPDGVIGAAVGGATALTTSSRVSGQGVGLPAGVDVAVGTQGVGAGVAVTTTSAQVRACPSARIHTHPTRPPLVHVTCFVPRESSTIGRNPPPTVIPRSMGERVISRVTTQVTIAYPRMDKGVPRWHT